MMIPLPAKPIYTKPSVKEASQHKKYLKSVSEYDSAKSLRQFLIRIIYTAIASVIFFLAFGPDEARLNNKLILRKNSAQIQEYIIVLKHLNSEIIS